MDPLAAKLIPFPLSDLRLQLSPTDMESVVGRQLQLVASKWIQFLEREREGV